MYFCFDFKPDSLDLNIFIVFRFNDLHLLSQIKMSGIKPTLPVTTSAFSFSNIEIFLYLSNILNWNIENIDYSHIGNELLVQFYNPHILVTQLHRH